jgi:hypothetical protein
MISPLLSYDLLRNECLGGSFSDTEAPQLLGNLRSSSSQPSCPYSNGVFTHYSSKKSVTALASAIGWKNFTVVFYFRPSLVGDIILSIALPTLGLFDDCTSNLQVRVQNIMYLQHNKCLNDFYAGYTTTRFSHKYYQ